MSMEGAPEESKIELDDPIVTLPSGRATPEEKEMVRAGLESKQIVLKAGEDRIIEGNLKNAKLEIGAGASLVISGDAQNFQVKQELGSEFVIRGGCKNAKIELGTDASLVVVGDAKNLEITQGEASTFSIRGAQENVDVSRAVEKGNRDKLKKSNLEPIVVGGRTYYLDKDEKDERWATPEDREIPEEKVEEEFDLGSVNEETRRFVEDVDAMSDGDINLQTEDGKFSRFLFGLAAGTDFKDIGFLRRSLKSYRLGLVKNGHRVEAEGPTPLPNQPGFRLSGKDLEAVRERSGPVGAPLTAEATDKEFEKGGDSLPQEEVSGDEEFIGDQDLDLENDGDRWKEVVEEKAPGAKQRLDEEIESFPETQRLILKQALESIAGKDAETAVLHLRSLKESQRQQEALEAGRRRENTGETKEGRGWLAGRLTALGGFLNRSLGFVAENVSRMGKDGAKRFGKFLESTRERVSNLREAVNEEKIELKKQFSKLADAPAPGDGEPDAVDNLVAEKTDEIVEGVDVARATKDRQIKDLKHYFDYIKAKLKAGGFENIAKAQQIFDEGFKFQMEKTGIKEIKGTFLPDRKWASNMRIEDFQNEIDAMFAVTISTGLDARVMEMSGKTGILRGDFDAKLDSLFKNGAGEVKRFGGRSQEQIKEVLGKIMIGQIIELKRRNKDSKIAEELKRYCSENFGDYFKFEIKDKKDEKVEI